MNPPLNLILQPLKNPNSFFLKTENKNQRGNTINSILIHQWSLSEDENSFTADAFSLFAFTHMKNFFLVIDLWAIVQLKPIIEAEELRQSHKSAFVPHSRLSLSRQMIHLIINLISIVDDGAAINHHRRAIKKFSSSHNVG